MKFHLAIFKLQYIRDKAVELLHECRRKAAVVLNNDPDEVRRFIIFMIRTTFVKHPYDSKGRNLAVQAKDIFIDQVKAESTATSRPKSESVTNQQSDRPTNGQALLYNTHFFVVWNWWLNL